MFHQTFYKFPLAVLLLSLIVTACTNSNTSSTKSEKEARSEDVPTIGKPDNFDYGKVENNVYHNSYFKCTMNIPKGWVIRDREASKKLHEKVEEEIVQGNESLKEDIAASDINSADLLGISKFDFETPSASNPNIMMIAENISANPSVKTAKDYLISAKKIMQQTQVDFEFLNEPKEEFINGKSFHMMNVIMHTRTADVHQRYYVTISKGFAFGIIEAYMNTDEDAFMHDYIYSIKFDQ